MNDLYSATKKTALKSLVTIMVILFRMALNADPCTTYVVQVNENVKINVTEESLTVTSFDGVKLKGTLTVPEHLKGFFIPVHGSFVQTREGDLDETAKWMFPEGVAKRRLFADMSKNLLDLGMGSFRYDKRASGESGGIYAKTDLMILSKDLVEIWKQLKARYPQLPIALVGQSEGALTVLKAMELGAKPDFVILQGPALDPFDKTLEFQRTRAAAPFLNDPTGELAKKFPYIAAFYQAMYSGDMMKRIKESREQTYTLRIGNWSASTSLEKYRQYLWNGFDLLKNVKVPTVVILGDEDKNVRPSAGSDILQAQKTLGLYPQIEVHILKGLEHSFREVEPNETFIQAMAKPVSPRYLEVLRDYVRRRLP